MEKVRDSKYELLRIVSMFMIVVWHVILWKYYEYSTVGMVAVLAVVMRAVLAVHVNSFILVSGYYQCESKFKASKFFALNNAAWFYRIVIMLTLTYFNVVEPSKLEMLDNIMPIDLSIYWFIDMYLILYCLSPFLNVVINKISKIDHQKLILVMLIIFSILPSITGQKSFFDNYGFSITHFMVLYFIGAYFKKYPINFFEFYNITSRKFKRLIYGSVFWGAAAINVCLIIFGKYIYGMSDIATRVSDIIKGMSFSYDNPLIVLGSVAYFLWFGCLAINSKFINKISSLTFGVYLIHENPYIKTHLYHLFDLNVNPTSHFYIIVAQIIGVALIIFISCAIIEWIRQIVFKFIYNLKVSGKLRTRFYNYIKEISARHTLDNIKVEA